MSLDVRVPGDVLHQKGAAWPERLEDGLQHLGRTSLIVNRVERRDQVVGLIARHLSHVILHEADVAQTAPLGFGIGRRDGYRRRSRPR